MNPKKIKIGLLYFFASVSALLALYIICVTVLDFFSRNSISFQILELSVSQIYLLDIIEIGIYLVLLVLLAVWIIKGKLTRVTMVSIAIWVFALSAVFIESFFHSKV